MRQFISGTDHQFQMLEEDARGRCISFSRQEMPAGTTPVHATVGFEVDLLTSTAKLFVERGLIYEGRSTEIGEWIRGGEKHFDNFNDLKNWIRGHLRQHYKSKDPAGSEMARVLRVPAIRTALQDPGQALSLNQQELEALLIAVLSLTPADKRPS